MAKVRGTRAGTASTAGIASPQRRSVSVAFALQGFLLATLVTQLPQFVDKHDLAPYVTVGAVFAVSAFAGLGSVLAEFLAARTSSATTLRIGLGAIAASATAIALAPTTPTLTGTFALYGLFLGVVDAAANMQGVRLQQDLRRPILSSMHAAWSLGTLTGAVYVSIALAVHLPLEITVTAGAFVVLALGQYAAGGFVHSGRQAAIDTSGVRIRRGPLFAIGIVVAVFYTVDIAMSVWSTSYFDDLFHPDEYIATLGLALYQVTALTSRALGDRLVTRVGVATALRVAICGGFIGLLIVITAPNAAVALVGCAVTGFGLPLLAPLSFGAASDLVPPEHLDAAIARINLFNYAGSIIGGAVIGALAAGTDSWRIGFALAAALVAASLIAIGRFPTSRPAV